MRTLTAAATGILVLSTYRVAGAQEEDRDLDLIPKEIEQAVPEMTSSASVTRSPIRAKLFLEDAFTGASAPRAEVVPYPAQPYDWQNRISFDVLGEWMPFEHWTITLSDRLNVLAQDQLSLFSRQTVRNDLRELFLGWEPFSNSYLEVGRINVRSGAALGFNPTDFFKTRTLVGQSSLDPSVIRQNRLGTLMARAQTIWDGGSASISFAPKLFAPPPIVDRDPLGIDPRIDTTNAAYRFLLTASVEIADVSPQALAYFEPHRTKLGLNLTRPFGDAVVAYAEWAGGPERNLISRAIAFGRETGTLPENAPLLPSTDAGYAFRNDLAAGMSWTIGTAVTLNLEYHFHQSALSRADWRSWFDIGGTAANAPPIAQELWYVRGYAQDQQEPTSIHQLFVRASWPRAFIPELELSGFAFVSLIDGSVLTQLSASYYASDAWTISAYGGMSVGGERSERGSLPQLATAIFSLTRYFP